HVLLLAPKDVVKPDAADAPDAAPEDRRRAAAERKAARDRRTLFAFDLQTSRLREEPALRLSVAELRAAAEARGDDLPTRTDRRGGERSALRLLFSCVAVEPRTGWIWLLSAVDRVLLAVDRDGTLQALHRLEAELLPKPEGVTFLPGGEMVLTSEGVDGPGRLVAYRRRWRAGLCCGAAAGTVRAHRLGCSGSAPDEPRTRVRPPSAEDDAGRACAAAEVPGHGAVPDAVPSEAFRNRLHTSREQTRARTRRPPPRRARSHPDPARSVGPAVTARAIGHSIATRRSHGSPACVAPSDPLRRRSALPNA